jgi:hypothetical protein
MSIGPVNLGSDAMRLGLAVVTTWAGCAIAQPLQWHRMSDTGPSARQSHAMAFDSHRGRTVLFGGDCACATGLADPETWEWNGVEWELRSTSGPSARVAPAMAYDAARQVVVMFGGMGSDGRLGDTWEWDGASWTLRCASCGPSPRFFHAMTFDSSRGVTVLFGGEVADVGASDETWEWNGSEWTARGDGSSPGPRAAPSIAFDSVRNVTVLSAGSQTWEWNGTHWTSRPSSGPPETVWHAMAFDSDREVTLFAGGYAAGFRSTTWEWNGTGWSQLQQELTPWLPRIRFAMVYDSVRREAVMFGGYAEDAVANASFLSAETWVLDGECPLVTTQPVDTFVLPGQAALLNFELSGVSTYSWRREGSELVNGPRVSGQGTTHLQVANLQPADQGVYDCIATTVCGETRSNSVLVSCKPVIGASPSDASAFVGEVVVLSAGVTSGGTTTYRWKKDGVNLFNGTVYSGVTTPALTIRTSDPTQTGAYTLFVANPCGTTITTPALVQVGCSADFNNDGAIDGDDVIGFFTAWDASDPAGDYNSDGSVDGDDVIGFFGRWDVGC